MVTCGLWRSSKWFRLLELKVVINVKCSVLHLSYHVLPYLRLLLRWGNTDLVENRFYIKGHWYKIINSFSKGWRRVSRNLSPILFQAALEKQPPRKCGGGYLQKNLTFTILISCSHLRVVFANCEPAEENFHFLEYLWGRRVVSLQDDRTYISILFILIIFNLLSLICYC